MLGIPYISETFQAILLQSTVIRGRFFVCPEWASEINSDNLEQLVKAATKEDNYRNFPAVLMMPPHLNGDFADPTPRLVQYPITLLFLTTTYFTGDNQVKEPDPLMGTSTHTIVHDWHDMQRCAQEFLRTFDQVIRDRAISGTIHLSQRVPHGINYISQMGNARLSGVAVNFAVNLFTSCVGSEDYPTDVSSAVVLPTGDSHPSHLH